MLQDAIKAGASGIADKREPFAVLLKAIECVHAGELWIERTMIAQVMQGVIQERLTPPRERRRNSPSAPPPASPTASERAAIAQLTPREHEIIRLIGEGLKNKQIASQLFVNEKTIHTHLASIFRKLEVSNRLELALFAYRQGWISSAS